MHIAQTELEFWQFTARERAAEIARLQATLAHVYALLNASLGMHVRHGAARDVEEAMVLIMDEVQE
jgi:hypothetical protein